MTGTSAVPKRRHGHYAAGIQRTDDDVCPDRLIHHIGFFVVPAIVGQEEAGRNEYDGAASRHRRQPAYQRLQEVQVILYSLTAEAQGAVGHHLHDWLGHLQVKPEVIAWAGRVAFDEVIDLTRQQSLLIPEVQDSQGLVIAEGGAIQLSTGNRRKRLDTI